MGDVDTRAQRPLVLVVEDDDAFAAELEAFLRERGCDAERVSNGEEALARLQRGRLPRLVLLDLFLPGKDGWDFYAEARRTRSLPHVPIVVLTGSSRISGGGLKGIVDFVRKPVGERTRSEFRRTLGQHLEEFAFKE